MEFNEKSITLLAFECRHNLADEVMNRIQEKAIEVAKKGGDSFMFVISDCLGFESGLVGEEVEKRVKLLGFTCEIFDSIETLKVNRLGISWKLNPTT